MKRGIAGVAWLVVLSALFVGLWRLGSGPLTAPPITDRVDLERWLEERDPVTIAFAVVRLVGLTVVAYVLTVTVLGATARLTRVAALERMAELATIPAARRLLGTFAGVGLTASAASLAASNLLPDPATAVAQELPPTRDAVILRRLPDGAEVELRRLPDVEGDDDGTATMRVVGPDDGGHDGDDTGERQWVTAPGDHLWHIAESTLADVWGRSPSDAEITPYWTQVVETNRTSLPDARNPDLIYAGQVLALPEPPPAP